MLYFNYKFSQHKLNIQKIDICLVNTVNHDNIKHSKEELEALFTGMAIEIMEPSKLKITGTGQLIILPMNNISWPDRSPVNIKDVLAKGAYVGLLDPNWRRIEIITIENHTRWRSKLIKQRVINRYLTLTNKDDLLRYIRKKFSAISKRIRTS